MMDLIKTQAMYVPRSLKYYASAYYLQLIILSAEPDVKSRMLVIEVYAQMYFCYGGTLMFRNHSGGKNKMFFNPCTDHVLLYLSFSTHRVYLFASEQWLSGSELSIQIINHPGSSFDPQPSTSGIQSSRCQVVSIILFLLCSW